MPPRSTTRLAHRREHYRLWFEYLRLAKLSSRKDIQEALRQSAEFYEPWGDVLAEEFHSWWQKKGQLFEEQSFVRRLKPGELPNYANSLVVEIPLNQSTTNLVRAVKALIEQAASEKQTSRSRIKRKTIETAAYRLSEGAEPKLRAVREMLTVYRDVHLKNPSMKGMKLLEAVQAFYMRRKHLRHRKVPNALMSSPDLSTPLRNLRRYIKNAEQITLNVAKGEFPGRY